MANASLIDGVSLCRMIEDFAPNFGCHVALTGGCLYRDGERKDIGILFYKIRQVDSIDIEGLKAALVRHGFSEITGFGWCFKGQYKKFNIDMFFPENDGGEYTAEEIELKEILINEKGSDFI